MFFTILFARSDWFPEPIYVRPARANYGLGWSSKTMTAPQTEMLDSWLNNLRGGISFSTRNLLIVPYDGPVKFAVKEGSAGMKSPEFRISFDFKQLLTDASYNDIANGVIYSTVNNLPFGLSVSIIESQ